MNKNGSKRPTSSVARGCNHCGIKTNTKILKCLHEFCVACLSKTLNSCLVCPDCGYNTQITSIESINSLPSAIVYDHISQDNCNHHPNQKQTHYCVSCQIPVCKLCVEKDHGEMPHVVKLVSETTDMFARCLKVAHGDALRTKNSLENSLATYRQFLDAGRAEGEKVKEAVLQRHLELSKVLQDSMEEALAKLETMEADRMAQNYERILFLQKGVEDADRCLETFNAVFDQASDLQKITYSLMLAGRNEELTKAEDFINPPVIQFVEGLSSLGDSIKSKFGAVKYTTDDRKVETSPTHVNYPPMPPRKPNHMTENAFPEQPIFHRNNGWYQTHLNPDYYNVGGYVDPSADRFFNKTPRPVRLSPMETIYKFGLLGIGMNCFSSPHGFCMGGTETDEHVFIADTNNHRVQIFKVDGQFVHNFGVSGRGDGQIWYPRKVAYLKTSGCVVVCDRGSERSRMQIFTVEGVFVRKIIIRYIDIVAGLVVTSFNAGFVRSDGSMYDSSEVIVAVDSVSPTVFIISELGDLLRWFDCSDHMREPSDIIVHNDLFYICDFKGHSVVVFNNVGKFIHKIGNENITNFPNGIDIGSSGDILVGDSHGNRFHVAVFSMSGDLITEFECPKIKVSRCCGLKITSQGYIVTLAKNNHHVLVLNRLFI